MIMGKKLHGVHGGTEHAEEYKGIEFINYIINPRDALMLIRNISNNSSASLRSLREKNSRKF